jgi:hypothetical protein
MKIKEITDFEPSIGDIVEFETDPDTVVEGVIVAETEDGYVFEFSSTGLTELVETCTYGKYYCSTDKKYKCRTGPKQSRTTEAANAAQQAAIAIAKKKDNDLDEEKQRLDPKCWTGYKKQGTKMKGGVRVNNCVPESSGYIPRNSKEAKDPRWSSALTDDVTTHTMRDQISKFFPTTAPNDGQEQIKEAEYQGRKVSLGKPMAGDVKKSKVYVRNDKGNVVKVNFGDPNMRIKKSNPKNRKSFRARHNCANPGPRWKARYWSCRAW